MVIEVFVVEVFGEQMLVVVDCNQGPQTTPNQVDPIEVAKRRDHNRGQLI